MNPASDSFIRLLKSPLRQRMFLLLKLPAAFFSGLIIRKLDHSMATVSVPFKWFTKNPFRSTYFACLSMAAEMSCGLLAMMQIHKRKPLVSMLVVNIESRFIKKATETTFFECTNGKEFEQIVDECIETGEARTYLAKVTGKNKKEELIAEFFITWSFKPKTG